jgi:hypothetical protein
MLELAAPLSIPTAVLALNYGDQIGPGRFGPDAAWVAGWGETGAGFPDELLTGRATLSSANACRATLGRPFGTFCASPPAGANACFGDSGGPLASFEGVVELLGIVSFGRVDCAGPVTYTNVGLYKPWIASVFRGGDPAVGMPEVRNTRLRQTAAGVEIYANWCQLAALGHRQRISYTLLHGARGFSRIRTITFVGRASGPCMEARGTIPAHRLGPGLWRLLVKVEDTSARLGYAARDISYIRVR